MNKRLLALMLLAVMALALLTLGGCGEQIGTVQGTVTQMLDPQAAADDPANVGPAIERATVAVYALERFSNVKDMEVYNKGTILKQALTDARGAYSFSLPKGEYVMEVRVGGFTVDSRRVEIKGGRTTDLSFNVSTTP